MDDSELVLALVRDSLEARGFEARTALTLAALESELAEHPPDLLILDVGMPEAFGDEVGMILRGGRSLGIPILLFSTLERAELLRRASEAGLDGAVSKTEGVSALVDEVERRLRGVASATVASTSEKASEERGAAAPTKALRVVVADDSWLCRAVLVELLEAEGDIRVVGEAENGQEAIDVVLRERPDAVTMDVQMPGMTGLDAIPRIVEAHPVPILVVTSEPLGPDSPLVFEALLRGAVDLLEKPVMVSDAAGDELRGQVRALAKVKVERLARKATPPPIISADSMESAVIQWVDSAREPLSHRPACVVGIAAGTGGSRAVFEALSGLAPLALEALVLVQPLPHALMRSHAAFLRDKLGLDVRSVRSDQPVALQAGCLYVPEGAGDLVVANAGISLVRPLAAEGGRSAASANVMLASLASAYGARAIGVVLSGAGVDGAEGLAALHAAGGLALVEDPGTAAVDEMPRAALERTQVAVAIAADRLARRVRGEGQALRGKVTIPAPK
jgi:two-component system chemotaxis response regulator CheB